jgi:hypothetical protein
MPTYACYILNLFSFNSSLAAGHPLTSNQGAVMDRDQNVGIAFFYQLERELEKVNSFYLQKESELVFVSDAASQVCISPRQKAIDTTRKCLSGPLKEYIIEGAFI